MAAEQSSGVPGFDYPAWCARLAGTIDFLLDDASDDRLALARGTITEYDAAIEAAVARAHASIERGENVIQIRPFSIHDAIDEVMPTSTRSNP